MAFTGDFMASQFKQDLLKARHDFTTGSADTFKIALYNSTAAFTASTTTYTSTDEMPATGGYSAGGLALNIPASMPSLTTTTAWVDFDDALWSASTITNAAGAMIYNTTPTSGTNLTVAILNFGGNKSSSSGDFTVQMPAANSTSAIIRIA